MSSNQPIGLLIWVLKAARRVAPSWLRELPSRSRATRTPTPANISPAPSKAVMAEASRELLQGGLPSRRADHRMKFKRRAAVFSAAALSWHFNVLLGGRTANR